MWIYFLGENLNFAVYLLASVASLSAAWLYFDTGKISKVLIPVIAYSLLAVLFLSSSLGFTTNWLFIPTFLAFILTSLQYRKQAYINLEKHLTPLFHTFLLLTAGQLFQIYRLFSDLNNPLYYPLVKTYGVFWSLSLIFTFMGTASLFKWVFHYLLKRLQTQLLIIVNSCLTIVFIFIAFGFSFLTFNSITKTYYYQARSELDMLLITLNSLKSQQLSETISLAADPTTLSALINNQSLPYLSKSITSTASGFVRQNNSLSLITTAPVYYQGTPSASVQSSIPIDSLFLNQIVKDTGINILLLAQNNILASSFQPEAIIGINVKTINQHQINLLGNYYFTASSPLTDSDNSYQASLAILIPTNQIISFAINSLHQTFFLIIAIQILFLYPTYLIAKHIETQFSQS